MNPKATLIIRIVLGLLLALVGLNKLFSFMTPPSGTEESRAFLHAMAAAGYFFPLVAITEIAVGVMLLTGMFVPLALAVLAPISVNVVLFHLVLDPAGSAVAVLVAVLNAALGFAYRDSFSELLEVG